MSDTGNSPSNPPSNRAAIADRIDSICDEFEAGILAGGAPQIEDFLEGTAPEFRPRLFKELLLVELEYRQKRGDRPSLDEYERRFPDYRSTLLSAGLVPESLSQNLARRRGQAHFAPKIPQNEPVPDGFGVGSRPSTEGDGDPAAQTRSWQPPRNESFSRFDFLRILGQGAFGVVWLARDRQLDRMVAVKVPLQGSLTPKEQEAFLREAKAAAQLQHPSIVQVHEAGREGDQVFIVSEFIEGATLKSHRETREYTPEESAALCARLADALDHAHQRGVIHRDLKPGNILIDEAGQPHVTDFGLAKRETADATWTRPGDVFGTPAYMSPEQARGEAARLDRRSDVYSLGVILYELLVGERPFTGEMHSVISKVLYLEPAPPRKRNSRIPRDLETICLKAMAKRPQDRYATAAELADDLRRYLAGECVLARRIGPIGRAWRWGRRQPAAVAAGVLGLVAVAAIVVPLTIPANSRPGGSAAAAVRTVLVTTSPPGAELAFFPRDAWTGEPLPQKRSLAGERSPARVELPPGDYLVVAKLDEQRFHEVFRHVPDEQESVPGAFRHLRWDSGDDGSVQLPEIKIPGAAVVDGMARIEGTGRFSLADTDSTVALQNYRSVPSFWIDPMEVSLGEYRAFRDGMRPASKNWKPVPDNYAVTETSDSAVALAEVMGKRLPTVAEYRYAATNRGRSRFPWGDDVPAVGEKETIGPVGTPAWDRLDTQPPVFGLASNVAEWTSTWRGGEYRIVCGGNDRVIAGDGVVTADTRDPRSREGLVFYTVSPGLGFRCVRSAKPRWNVEDFETLVPTDQSTDATMP